MTATVITEMATLLAQQKLIPFFGAGISRPHLGLAAAELARDMAQEIGADPATLLSQLSDDFADKRGEAAFVEFLRKKLVVSTLDDTKASTHRLLLSLGQNLLYTTNQDNIFELVGAKYGRPYRRIVTLNDLSDAIPGERLLIKFHGDADVPQALVFGSRSYRARLVDAANPLDIKLRADLLGKRLLFLGYSFGDENVAKLFDAVRKVFAGAMPPSYLIAFEYTPAMAELEKIYGITVVDPKSLFKEPLTSAEAFERCLKELCDCTISLQAKAGLDNLFSSGKVNVRMVTDYEVSAVTQAIDTPNFADAIHAFRGAFDQAVVPGPMQEAVMSLFQQLADKVNAADDKEMSELKGALFNIRLPTALSVQACARVMAACNRRPARDGFDSLISLSCPAMPDNALPAAAAMAVAVLRDRGETITEKFRRMATFWFEGWEELPPPIKDTAKAMIDSAWTGSETSYTPLMRPGFLPRKGFHDIMRELTNNMPAEFKNPEK